MNVVLVVAVEILVADVVTDVAAIAIAIITTIDTGHHHA